MQEVLYTPEASEAVIVFVGEAARSAGGLAWGLECLGYVTVEAPSVGEIDRARAPVAVVVPAEAGVDPFRSVRAVRTCPRLVDSLVFAWAPGELARTEVAVGLSAGADDVVGGRLRLDESVDRIAARVRDKRTRRDIDPISARRLRDTGELLARERDARRQLEAEKTVRERLLGIMTRELVTQANVALGWLNLMQREHLDARARDNAFAKITAALNAQISMADELVGMSPAAVGHVNLDCRRVDVAALARAVAADVGDERAHVISTENAVVVADVEHMVRALRALITATTRDEDSVTIRVTASDDYAQVRFSSAIHDGDEALGVALRVAELYAGAITVADGETLFELPIAASG